MTTNSSTTPDRDPLEEAVDPTTDPERLRHLAVQEGMEVRWAVLKNPAVPEDVWRKALLEGDPEAWSNPMAPIYLLVWSPQPGDRRTLEEAARHAMYTVWKLGKQVSPDGKSLLNGKILEWWVTSVSAEDMMDFLWTWASRQESNNSIDYRELVRILVLCARTLPYLTEKDIQALNILETWCTGGDDRRKEVFSINLHHVVRLMFIFSSDPYRNYTSSDVIAAMIYEVAFGKEGTDYNADSKAEYNKQLTKLIRREMPLPPGVKFE